MLGLAVVVCTVTLLGLTPWEPEESVPSLAQPTPEARVGDAVAVPTVGPAVAVVEAAVAPGEAKLVSRPDRSAREAEEPEGGPAVGPALAVAVSPGRETGSAPGPAPLPESASPEAPAVTTPAPEPAAVPAAPPSSSPPAKSPDGPVAVGSPGSPLEEELGEEEAGGEEACAGDEYTLRITPLEAEGEAVTIVLEHVAADGSTETLELEGDLEDARSLVLQLSSEGGCVEVEVVPSGDEVEEAPSQPPVTP